MDESKPPVFLLKIVFPKEKKNVRSIDFPLIAVPGTGIEPSLSINYL
jgi:hypothetical protein